MASVEFECAGCGKLASAPTGHVNRARARGVRIFCGIACFALARTKPSRPKVRKIKPEPAMVEAAVREWRILRDFPDYEISNDGRLRRATAGSNTKSGAHIRTSTGVRGYPQYGLTRPDGVRVHRTAHVLVAAEFLPPQPAGKPFVLHGNDDRLDCRDTNLRWGSAAENTADAKANNRLQLGENHPSRKKPWTRPHGTAHSSAKLTEDDVRQIMADGRFNREIAAAYDVDQALVGRIKQGKVWKHITNPEYSAMLEAGRAQDAA